MLREVPFGAFLPDFPDYQNPGCTRAHNVVPSSGGYNPLKGAGNTSGNTSGTCRGAKLLFRSTGDAITVGGGDDKLWLDISGTVVVTTGMTSIGSDAYWQFHRFGQYVFAVSANNDMQYLSAIDSDTTWSAHPDAPAQAQVIGEVDGRLMVGNLSSNPYGYQWAALNNPLVFTADNINYTGTGEVQQEYGELTGIRGDRFPLIFQQWGISRINRVGPPTVFDIETIEEARGAIAPNSIVTVGFRSYFLAHDGFYYTDGAQSVPIGTRKVNKFFLGDASDVDIFSTHGS